MGLEGVDELELARVLELTRTALEGRFPYGIPAHVRRQRIREPADY